MKTLKKDRPYAHICEQIDNYFRENNLKYIEVARRLGMSQAAVSGQLSGNTPFGNRAAKKWSEAFCFNPVFLMYGTGDLLSKEISTGQSDGTKQGISPVCTNEMSTHVVGNLLAIGLYSGSFFVETAIRYAINEYQQSSIDDLISLIKTERQMTEAAKKMAEFPKAINSELYDELYQTYISCAEQLRESKIKF